MTAIDAFRQDPRLPNDRAALSPKEYRDCVLCTGHARRQALVEINVLAAQALGLTLDDAVDGSEFQFPFVRQYEAETYYDANGHIVFTLSKGTPGVGFLRKALKGDTSYMLRTLEGTKDGIRAEMRGCPPLAPRHHHLPMPRRHPRGWPRRATDSVLYALRQSPSRSQL